MREGQFCVTCQEEFLAVLEKISYSTRTSTVTYFLQDRGEFFSASVCKKFETILCRLKIVESCEKQSKRKAKFFLSCHTAIYFQISICKKILATNVMIQTVVFATGRNQGLWLCAPLNVFF